MDISLAETTIQVSTIWDPTLEKWIARSETIEQKRMVMTKKVDHPACDGTTPPVVADPCTDLFCGADDVRHRGYRKINNNP